MKLKTNVFRLLGKQGTGALILSSRRARFRQLPPSLPTLASREQPASFPSFRHFSSTHVLSDEPFQTTFEDPSRKGLFYHLVPPPTPLSNTHPVFALSLLPDPPPLSKSCTVLGWLPAETPGDDHEAGLNDFVENARFLPLLHEAISNGLAEAVDDIQAAGALQLGEGWMHIHDDRNIPPLNRIGDPDDILASVRVQDGKAGLFSDPILAETYQAMPSYRVCTAHGVTQLTEGLASKLRGLLEARAREEGRRANT
ncbi:hypothetical protein BJV78DRAFT_1125541 [Lactifluus subvellereus]|nr:hypothetical protein BJV78DRAFT_1125541 [Lactifluus subvellereus]